MSSEAVGAGPGSREAVGAGPGSREGTACLRQLCTKGGTQRLGPRVRGVALVLGCESCSPGMALLQAQETGAPRAGMRLASPVRSFLLGGGQPAWDPRGGPVLWAPRPGHQGWRAASMFPAGLEVQRGLCWGAPEGPGRASWASLLPELVAPGHSVWRWVLRLPGGTNPPHHPGRRGCGGQPWAVLDLSFPVCLCSQGPSLLCSFRP